MRRAGDLPNEQQAQVFADYLLTLGITSRVDHDGPRWQIWVHDETRLEEAREELEDFLDVPDDPRYKAAPREAAEIRKREQRRERAAAQQTVDLRSQWRGRGGMFPATLTLIGLSLVATIVTGRLGGSDDETARKAFRQVQNQIELPLAAPAERGFLELPQSVLHGQVWRLITPIFPHGGFFHLLFNMWFLFLIGQMIEVRRGTWRFLGLVLLTAVGANLGQYWWYVLSSAPPLSTAIGMSGVLYGIFGYAWVKTALDPSKGIYLSGGTILWLMAWLLLCMTGRVGNIANAAHVSGLILGAAAGYAPLLWAKLRG